MSSPMERKHCQSPDPSVDCSNKRPRGSSDIPEASLSRTEVLDGSLREMPESNPPGALTVQIKQLLELDEPTAAQGFNILDFYLAMWECYIMKSAQVIRLEDENRKLQSARAWLICEKDLLKQQFREAGLILDDRKKKATRMHQMLLKIMPLEATESVHSQD